MCANRFIEFGLSSRRLRRGHHSQRAVQMDLHCGMRLNPVPVLQRIQNCVMFSKRMVASGRALIGRVQFAPHNDQPHAIDDFVDGTEQGITSGLGYHLMKITV